MERPKGPDEALTAPDVPAALGAVPPLPRGRAAVHEEDTEISASMELLPVGSLVGARYVIEQHISSGGFGAVYRASDRDIRHHQVALKLLHHPSASEDERQAALRELKLLATVTHPSVVQFKEYGWHEGRLWFAMPWYHGQTLDGIIGDGTFPGGLSRAEARPLFTRLAHGLAAMHAVGIHHHDIKPENIFVAEIAGFPGGLPVLLDLGIATQRGEHPVGLTVEYASPETAAAMLGDASRPIGGAADVFSLALVLRNALDPTLIRPVATSDVREALRERATKPASLSGRRSLAFMDSHFRRWLSHDPNQRPTAAELADELAILTQPEEKRQARVRFFQRVAPGLLLIGLMVTALAFQLNRKETALVVKGRELEQQRQVSEALRKQSAAQLDQLDVSARKLGDERRLLKRALAFARTLNEQLAAAATRFEELDRRHTELTTERDNLSLERDRLTSELEGLTDAHAALTREREALVTRRDELKADLTRVSGERDDIARQRDRLSAETDRANIELREHEKRIDILTKERDRLTRVVAEKDERHEAVSRERADAVSEVKELKGKLAQANTEQAQLERKLAQANTEQAQLERKLAQANTEQAQLERKVRTLNARPAPAPRPVAKKAAAKKKPKPRRRPPA